MDPLILFRRWFADFERCVADDDWSRLLPYLAEGVEYRVHGVPFGGVVQGAAAVLAGFKKSFDGFDRRMDHREHWVVGTQLRDDGSLHFRTWTRYTKAGLPPLAFPARAEFQFADGRIASMQDFYELELAETQAAMVWFGQHAEALGLDPSYA